MFNMDMNYEEAKIYRQKLEAKNKVDSDKLKEFDQFGESVMGLTPDHIKDMPEWKEAKNQFQQSFAEMRSFNGWFVKKFKKEYAEDRRKRYK